MIRLTDTPAQKQASQGAPFLSPANKINLSNKLKDYIIYGQAPGDKFNSKRLTILALTGMLKFIAGPSIVNLRHATDEAGYLKRVKTPGSGSESYMTVKWDQLVPFPSSMYPSQFFAAVTSSTSNFWLTHIRTLAWNLRFDEIEKGENGHALNGHVH